MASSDQIPKFDPFSTAEARGLVAICAFFMLLAGLGVAARFWSRSIKNVAPALDDWLVVVGLGFYLVTGVMTILQVKLGALGHHLKEVTDPQRLIVEGKIGTFEQYAYGFAMGFTRASICVLLHRIFITKAFHFAILVVSIINVLWIIFNTLIVSLRCIPFRANWDMSLSGACLNQVPIVLGVAIWGLVVEVAIWSLPIPMAWSLQMPRRHKIALTLIFGLGILTITSGIVRVITILQVSASDPTWTEIHALQWLAIEPSIAIVVTCMPVCRPLLEKLMPKNLRRTLGQSRSSGRSRTTETNPVRAGQDDRIMLVVRKNNTKSLDERDLENGITNSVSHSVVAVNSNFGRQNEDVSAQDVIHVRKDYSVVEGSQIRQIEEYNRSWESSF